MQCLEVVVLLFCVNLLKLQMVGRERLVNITCTGHAGGGCLSCQLQFISRGNLAYIRDKMAEDRFLQHVLALPLR